MDDKNQFEFIMPLHEKIESDIVSALKSGDALRRSVLVLLKSAIGNKVIAKGGEKKQLADDEIEKIISTEVKRRKDTAIQYRNGGRDDKAEQEEKEIVILMEYLPPQLTNDAIEVLVQKAIEQVKPSDEKDFGKVMAVLSPDIKGKADGSLVVKIVKEKLLR